MKWRPRWISKSLLIRYQAGSEDPCESTLYNIDYNGFKKWGNWCCITAICDDEGFCTSSGLELHTRTWSCLSSTHNRCHLVILLYYTSLRWHYFKRTCSLEAFRYTTSIQLHLLSWKYFKRTCLWKHFDDGNFPFVTSVTVYVTLSTIKKSFPNSQWESY